MLLALTTLLFDEDLEVDETENSENIIIKTVNSKFIVPKIKVKLNGI